MEDLEEEGLYKASPTRLLNTPFGIMTIGDHNLVAKQFDFWTLHTNFDITPEIVDIIENVPGVETLDVLTRYRARVGFPKSGFFDSSVVKVNIQNAIYELDKNRDVNLSKHIATIFNNDVAAIVMAEKEKVEDSTSWAIFILPNGELTTVVEDDQTIFNDSVQKFTELQSDVGGYLITSRDYI